MLMAYTKTQWNENTPITADKLNKIETGVENAIDKTTHIMEIPITHSGGWHQFRWTKPGATAISWTRDVARSKAFEVYNENLGKTLLLLNDDGNLTVYGNLGVHSPIFEATTDLVVNRHDFRTYYTNNQNGSFIHCEKNNSSINLTDGKMTYANPHGSLEIGPQNAGHCHIYTDRPTFYFNRDLLVNDNKVWHTGNFNPNGKLDAGAYTVHDRDLRVYGKRAMVGFNTELGNYLHLNYERDFAEGVKIEGLLRTDSITSSGKLAFSNIGTGGGLHANIHNLALHYNTGNGQMMTADNLKIYVGNPSTALAIESNTTPDVKIGNSLYKLIHTGSLRQKMTFGQYTSSTWRDAQIEINAGATGGVARLNFHRESYSQMSIIHKDKDKLHVELDNGAQQRILTDGDSCARFSWNGSRITIDNGGNNAAVSFSDTSDVAHHVRNHHTGKNFKFRADAGLKPLEGEITFTW